MSSNTPTDFGRDLDAGMTLSTTRTASGVALVVNACIRRFRTKRGVLYFHREYGLDLQDLLGQATTPDGLRKAAAAIVDQCEQDPRIFRGSFKCAISVTNDANGLDVLTVSCSGDTAIGPFDFVITVDNVTFAIIGVTTGAST